MLAGSRPGTDPFAAAHGTDLKALIPVGGKPLVRWPVEALLASDRIGRIAVLGQHYERLGAVLPADPRLTVSPSQATIAATLLAAARDPATEWPILVTTGDHALLNPAMIDDFLRQSRDSDVAIGVVERRNLEARLPGSRRTWHKFRRGAYSGANLFLLGTPRVTAAIDLWRDVEQDRKKGWKLMWRLGPAFFPGTALRLRTLDQTLDRLGKRLGLVIRSAELSDPLACVDVDKQADLDLVEPLLEGRG